MRVVVALAAGLIFGFGLALSQMIDPAKVLAFLDVAGAWDPSLAFVMIGALTVAAPAYALAARRARPLYGDNFAVPTRRDIDKPLAFGALLFGAGWGLAGYCPGPAIASLTFGLWQTWLFVAAMLAGMALHRVTRGV
ncbi:MAG: DUF6691 family protein [Alphaproteobacteria bacterium]